MLAIVASRLDPSAAQLVDSWSPSGAALLSAEDLCVAGWSFRVGAPSEGFAVVAGERVAVSHLRGVLTRRPAVVPEELPWIDVADRAYVAAETNAFLVAWLASLPCPVVNRPTPRSLCGPGWDRPHWRAAAARVGAPWYAPSDERTSEIDDHLVIVCGHACVGARSRSERTFARALAEAAGVQLLGVRFVGGCVASASPMPDISDPEVEAAVLAHLLAP